MFFERLEKLSAERSTTVTAVVRDLGYSKGSMSHWKKGSCPSGDIVVRFADYFSVTTDYLLTGKESLARLNQNKGDESVAMDKVLARVALQAVFLCPDVYEPHHLGPVDANLISGIAPYMGMWEKAVPVISKKSKGIIPVNRIEGFLEIAHANTSLPDDMYPSHREFLVLRQMAIRMDSRQNKIMDDFLFHLDIQKSDGDKIAAALREIGKDVTNLG